VNPPGFPDSSTHEEEMTMGYQEQGDEEEDQHCEGRAFCGGDELMLVDDYSGRGPRPRKRLLCKDCAKAMRAAEAEECRGDYKRDLAKDGL